jgi:thiol-disulfide isomerase/thioredoxin
MLVRRAPSEPPRTSSLRVLWAPALTMDVGASSLRDSGRPMLRASSSLEYFVERVEKMPWPSSSDMNSDFDKLFRDRFNELDSLVSSSPSSPVLVQTQPYPRPCGLSERHLLSGLAFIVLTIATVAILVYIYRKLDKTRSMGYVARARPSPAQPSPAPAAAPSAPSQALPKPSPVPLPSKVTEGAVKVPSKVPDSSVKVVETPDDIVPKSDERLSVVMFFATWCGHCSKMKPDFIEASTKHPDCDFSLVENTVLQAHPQADSFNVTGFPHVVAYAGNKALGTMVGNQGPQKLNEFITTMKAAHKK